MATHLGDKKVGVNYITYRQPESPEKVVTIFDPYGDIIAEYTKSEFLALSNYPAPPSLTGLTFSEYNWDLSVAKTFIQNADFLYIGAVYNTTSGLCEFDIELTKATGLTVTFNMLGNVNWGDGTSETISASNTTHTYNAYGKYTITSDGSTLPAYIMNQNNLTIGNDYFTGCRLGTLITSITSNAFRSCKSLREITLPNTINSIGVSAFSYINKTSSGICIVIPKTVTVLPISVFESSKQFFIYNFT